MLKKLFGLPIYIKQTKAQAFNLDTLLLAHFMRTRAKAKHILDVGTGNGVLLFYLQERTKAKITGIEIQENRAIIAQENIKLNHLEDQMEVIHLDYEDYDQKNVDMIISNPPFFKMTEKKHLSKDDERLIARFEVRMTLEAFIRKSSKLLKQGGYLTFIHRPERLDETIMLLHKYQLSVKRMRFVHSSGDKPANHLLIEALKNGKQSGVNIEPPLIIYDENKKLTEEMSLVYKGEVPCF